MAKSKYVILLLLLIAQFSFAQDGRYVIFFTDKTGSAYTVHNPLQFLSQRSIDRRIKNGVVMTEEDFPVNVDYLNQIKGLGAQVLHSSRWMNCALVQLEGSELSSIMSLPIASSSQFVGPTKIISGGRIKDIGKKTDSKSGEANLEQNATLGIDIMHGDNILGQGVTIAVFDSGFMGVDMIDPFKSLLQEGRLQYTEDLVGKSGNVFQYDDHGTEVLSVMAANQEGTYLGGAPQATYQLYVTEDVDSEFKIEEYNWLIAAEKADSAGVDIISTSLGYTTFDDPSMDYTTSQLNGNIAIVSKAASMAIAKGILVVVSAGNDGDTSWQFINPPADVEGILAVGSVTGSGSLSSFSSIGPTADGRIKPDVVALGSSSSVVKVNGATGFASGTSVSAPLVTSLAAGLLQSSPELTVAELYDLIITSGDRSQNPDNQFGYGIPSYLSAKQIVTGEKPMAIGSSINLFPNPVVGNVLRIEVGQSAGQLARVSIYSLQGKLAMRTEVTLMYEVNSFDLDVSGFASGVFIVKVETDSVLKTIRLVKL